MIPTRALGAALSVACPGISAQEVLWQAPGIPNVLTVGKAELFDDIDGDGYQDLIGWAKYWPAHPFSDATHFVSGRDGSTLRIRPICSTNASYTPYYASLAVAGDMDRDGIREYARTILVGVPPINTVEVRSGKDDRLLWQVTGPWDDSFGFDVIGDLDVNGDGRPDLVVSAETVPPKGEIYAYDDTGRLLYKIVQQDYLITLGRLGGDLDRDGCDDFLAGGFESQGLGGVFVYSGRTGQVLVAGYGEYQGDGLGTGMVMGCGDVDGDRVLDFLGSSPRNAYALGGSVRVFSGRTGQAIHTYRKPGSFFGSFLAVGDLDLDGIADLLVNDLDPTFTYSVLAWYSLRDGALVTTLYPPDPPASPVKGYLSVAIGKPHPGSPFPVITALDTGTTGGLGGYALRHNLLRSVPKGVKALGAPCAGTLPAVPLLGFRDLGTTSARLHLTGAPRGATAFLVAGLSSTSWGGLPLPLSLTPAGFPGCSLTTSVDAYLVTAAGTSGVNAGFAWVDVPKLPVPLYGQWIVAGAGPTWPGGVTEGLQW